MSRGGGTTLYVTGFGHGTRARDLAYEFERYVNLQGPIEGCNASHYSEDSHDMPALIKSKTDFFLDMGASSAAISLLHEALLAGCTSNPNHRTSTTVQLIPYIDLRLWNTRAVAMQTTLITRCITSV